MRRYGSNLGNVKPRNAVLVTVDVVHVGHVRMDVLNWAMLVPMGVRFARWVFWPMLVLMMFIM